MSVREFPISGPVTVIGMEAAIDWRHLYSIEVSIMTETQTGAVHCTQCTVHISVQCTPVNSTVQCSALLCSVQCSGVLSDTG